MDANIYTYTLISFEGNANWFSLSWFSNQLITDQNKLPLHQDYLFVVLQQLFKELSNYQNKTYEALTFFSSKKDRYK